MSGLVGKWEYVSSENVIGGLKALGAPEELAAKASTGKPNYEISNDGDKWTITLQMEGLNKEWNFKLGEEFENTTPAGIDVKSIVTLDGNTMTEMQKMCAGGKEIKVVRVADDSTLTTQMFVDDQTTTIKFKRI